MTALAIIVTMTIAQPLHDAAARSDARAISSLLRAGAAVNAVDGMELTPLHRAVMSGCVECAELLLDSGADPNARGRYDMTPLHWAALLGRTELAGLLLRRGARVQDRNLYGMTALHESSAPKLTELLLAQGADLHARDYRGFTPLHLARNGQVAKVLIDRGADIGAGALDGHRPIDLRVQEVGNSGLVVYGERAAVRLRGEAAEVAFGIRNARPEQMDGVSLAVESPACDATAEPARIDTLYPAQWTTVRFKLARRAGLADGEHPFVLIARVGERELARVPLTVDTNRGETPEDRGMIRIGKGRLRPEPSRLQYLAYAAVPLLVVGGWILFRRTAPARRRRG
jgi:hypothetical protein